jgi:glutathione S-transferase
MITIHHLGVSQSDRVVWLMEELGLPYKLVWYDRGPDNLMPASYRALHPAATAPVIQDGDRTIAESAAILEYICHKYGRGRFTVRPDAPNYPDYVYWMHFNNNALGLFFARLALGANPPNEFSERISGLIQGREDGYARFMEQTLAKSPYLAGDELTCADVMTIFNLVSLPSFVVRTDMPNAKAYVARISERPAYIKAMQIAGPSATRPEGS